MRLSQAQFADAVRAAGNAMGVPNHCTKRLVQKWETGEHAACRPDYLRVLQAVTGLAARELGFPVLPEDSDSDAAAAMGGAYGSDSASAADPAPISKLLATAPITDAVEASRDQLRHALNHPSRVDSRAAELVATATSHLFDLEHHSPARLLAPTVDRHLATTTALLTAAKHEAVRRALMASAGRTALLAGWLAFDRGDLRSAHRLWDDAIGVAESIADIELFAASLLYQSYAAARRSDPGTAWQLAHSAALQAQDDSRAQAWAMACVGLYAAQLGEHEAARSAMDRSMAIGETLADPKPGDGGQSWTRCFNRARLLSARARTAALLEDPDAADYATKAVDALDTAVVKVRVVVLAEAALTTAIAGDLKLCLEYGSQAAALARRLDVSLAADLLHDVIPLVLTYSDTREARELLPQLTRLTRSADRENEADSSGPDVETQMGEASPGGESGRREA